MTEKEFLVLQSKIAEELNNISLLKSELDAHGLLSKEKSQNLNKFFHDDNFKARAVGSILHDYYVAVENIFKLIAREVDESVPSDPSWHISLLKQMSVEIKGLRPAVISKETAQKIDQYRAFRHVFRNVYGFNLDTSRLKLLLQDFLPAVASLCRDLEEFQERIKELI